MTNSAFSAHLVATSARRLCCFAAVVGLLASCGGSDANSTSSTTLDPSITTTSAPPDSPALVPTPTTTVSASDAAVAAQSTTTVAVAPTTTAPKTAAPTTAGSATAAASSLRIPESIQGVWRQSDAVSVSVTAAQCDEANSADNIGNVLTIGANGFSIFEDGGRLLEIYTSDASSIDARFDTTYADTPTEDRLIFRVQDSGSVLILSDFTRPGSVRYVRCP